MLGITDPWIWSAYLLCILAALVCVAYGAIMWHHDGEAPPSNDDVQWAKDEEKLEEEL
jgi:hypothetical protein